VAWRAAVAVDAVEHDVGHAAHAPVREGPAVAEVQHPVVRTHEAIVEKADQRVVKPGRIPVRAFVERVEAVDAERAHEAGQVG
jgi:hypothetical protein